MYIYNIDSRIQTYKPITEFLALIDKKAEKGIEDGKWGDWILLPISRSSKQYKSLAQDLTEGMIIVALTAKKMLENYENDPRDIIFGLSKLAQFLVMELPQKDIRFYSNSDEETIEKFVKNFVSSISPYHPRFDDNILTIFKIEYLVNSLLYFAKTMNERRFPYGSDYYEFLSFLINEIYIIFKPKLDQQKNYLQGIISKLQFLFNYTSIVYIVEHNPSQTSELAFILSYAKSLKLTKEEKSLIKELLTPNILITSKTKKALFKKL